MRPDEYSPDDRRVLVPAVIHHRESHERRLDASTTRQYSTCPTRPVHDPESKSVGVRYPVGCHVRLEQSQEEPHSHERRPGLTSRVETDENALVGV